ncbi:MAG: MBL fold metallo-hydrolase [Deltaproteobacteria bacterium]|nr:MBL fold metallo-hydrolase [Deltaproteobacteria bacterium]
MSLLSEFPRTGRVVFCPGPNRSPYPNCNGLYVEGDIRILIDQGGSAIQAKSIAAGPGIDRLYVTHWHEDHALSACQLPEIPLFAPAADREPIETRKATHARGGIHDKMLQAQMDALYDGMGFTHRKVDSFVEPESEIDLGGITMIALHAPGHTSGHTCYWFPKESVLVLGDYDLTRAGPVCPDLDSSVRNTYQSLARLQRLPVKFAAAAHGRGWFDGEEYKTRMAAYLEVLDRRLDAILDLVRAGDTTIPSLARHFQKLFNFPVLPGYEAWGAVSGQMLIRPMTRYLCEEERLIEPEPDRFEAV